MLHAHARGVDSMRATLRTYSTRNRDGVAGRAAGAEGAGEDEPRGELTEEELSAERQRMIEDRQSELARVLDKHDDLVCSLSLYRGCY